MFACGWGEGWVLGKVVPGSKGETGEWWLDDTHGSPEVRNSTHLKS